jgi:DNA-binding NarL/FixJ family response regulator
MKEVGGILNVSEKTVMFHKYHIMRSLNVRSNAELVLLALNQGLISA